MVRSSLVVAVLAFGVAWTPPRAVGQCCGDCNGNGTVVIHELVTAVNNALGPCETLGCPLPATGQTTAYGPGSDGDVQAGVALPYMDNFDGTITDNNTGLMWEKKDDFEGIHDKDNTYTWGMGDAPYTMNGTMVTEFLDVLNTEPCFASYCDWRIPNVRELQSLVDYERADPAVRAAFNENCRPGCTVDADGGPRCSCTESGSYWSATTGPGRPSNAWIVDFYDGVGDGNLKSNLVSVRAVRDGL